MKEPNQITAANAGKRLGFAGKSRVGLSPRPGVAEFHRSTPREFYMKKCIFFLSLLATFTVSVYAFKSVRAKWNHEMSVTVLQGSKKGEHLVISAISSGTPGVDAVQKYRLEITVNHWGELFSTAKRDQRNDPVEILKVTLWETENPKEMKCDFTHEVYENGKEFLKFSGITILPRLN